MTTVILNEVKNLLQTKKTVAEAFARGFLQFLPVVGMGDGNEELGPFGQALSA